MIGRYTGRSDIPLTANGEKKVTSSSYNVVGPGKIIDPSKLASIFISPALELVGPTNYSLTAQPGRF
jgi:sedoheptulose-bisphosphatase